MLYPFTLNDIETNINTGIEYEIALFAKLIEKNCDDYSKVIRSIHLRHDCSKVMQIMRLTNILPILNELDKNKLNLKDVSFETQNDEVGPADIILIVEDSCDNESKIGLSVKYANTCTLNVTGKNFITDSQITVLKSQLHSYTQQYILEMTNLYGGVDNWFRKRKPSKTTDAFIDLIRDAVIDNWAHVKNKEQLLSFLVGHMQVKFNNGFVEKCKKKNPDITCEGVKMSYGQPFSSWNFSVEK